MLVITITVTPYTYIDEDISSLLFCDRAGCLTSVCTTEWHSIISAIISLEVRALSNSLLLCCHNIKTPPAPPQPTVSPLLSKLHTLAI